MNMIEQLAKAISNLTDDELYEFVQTLYKEHFYQAQQLYHELKSLNNT